MTGKKAKSGWLVSVTSYDGSDQAADFYEVAERAPIAAEHAVLRFTDAIDQKIEAVEPMPSAVLDRLGLRPGEVRKRTCTSAPQIADTAATTHATTTAR